MIETFIAFSIWASAGTVFSFIQANPIQTALFRYFFAGLLLQIVERGFKYFKIETSLTDPVVWAHPKIWLAGAMLVVGNIFFNMSVSSGPVAIAGLIYGYIPLVVPLVSLFFGLEQKNPLSRNNWIGFSLAFFGNYCLFLGFHKAEIAVGNSVVTALLAAMCFGIGPLLTADLQKRGMRDWCLLKCQNTAAMIVAVPLAAFLISFDFLTFQNNLEMRNSLYLGIFASIGFTVLPFYLWFRGIRKVGPARTTIFVFLNPLIGCLISVFVLKDIPISLLTLGGISLILAGIVLNMKWAKGLKIHVPRPAIQALSILIVIHPFLFPLGCWLILGWQGEQLLSLMLHPFHFFVIAFSCFTAWAIFSMRRYAALLLGVFLATVAGEAVVFTRYATDSGSNIAIPVFLIFTFLALGFFAKRMRWSRRISLTKKIDIKNEKGEIISATLMDLSESGFLFILDNQLDLTSFMVGRSFSVKIYSGSEVEYIEAKVTAVRNGQVCGKFLDLNEKQRQITPKWHEELQNNK